MKPLHLDLGHLPPSINTLYIAFSSGIDSVALLHLLQKYRSDYSFVLWHINHGLQPNAEDMEIFAAKMARQYADEYRVDHLSLDPSTGNLEAKARFHRYQLFEQALSAKDALLTAHHMNDQAETLLMNLMRGSGPAGLSAIADQKALGKGLLWRPLLNFTRPQIELYAQQHELEWIDDPSNQDLSFDRNYLRHQVVSKILKRWPAAIQQIHRASQLQKESNELQLELARMDMLEVCEERPFTPYQCLSTEALLTLSAARQKNLVRFWLQQNIQASIGFNKMQELLNQLNSRLDAMPMLQGKLFQIRNYQRHLYIVPEAEPLSLELSYDCPESGEVIIEAIGFRQSRQQIFDSLKLADKGQNLSLKFRQHIRNQPTSYHHRLKRLFQKHQVPPWVREQIPIIFVDQELIGLWLF